MIVVFAVLLQYYRRNGIEIPRSTTAMGLELMVFPQ